MKNLVLRGLEFLVSEYELYTNLVVLDEVI